MERFEASVGEIIFKVDKDILDRNDINVHIYNKMLEVNQDEVAVKKYNEDMERNYNKLMNIEKPDFQFEFPKEITKENYFEYLKLSYAKLRYEIYHEVQKIMKETGQQSITNEQFGEVIKKVSLPDIKEKVYTMMNYPEVPGEKSPKTALKAYLVHMQEDEMWSNEVLCLQKSHKELLLQIPQGIKGEEMNEDPLEVFERERECENQLSQKKNAPNAPKEDQKSLDKSTESNKGNGSFSFLGNQKDQQNLVQEFLNRDKKKTDQIKEVAEEENQDNKPEEVKEEKDTQEPKALEKSAPEAKHNSPKVLDEANNNKEDAAPEGEKSADNEEQD
ncbi:unnamed protein product [Moneuplotes crassus]|uniref:Uncharacterized protein n=1 Tax=Euplotes crassus TaxID=5936 RepID=A0AAD1UKV4_EUPCR|nr:unnamed protein product [Moneuplotes crassus]